MAGDVYDKLANCRWRETNRTVVQSARRPGLGDAGRPGVPVDGEEQVATTAMTREEFVEWLRREFPRLLQEDPRFSAEVVGILSQTLGSRMEFNRLLAEMKALREDFGRRFEVVQRHLESMESRFEQVDRRFEAIDRRFEAAERRFEAIDRRFEEANRRFEAIERTLVAHSEVLAEHTRALRRLETGLGSLGGRFGEGFEETIRATVEEFSGLGPLRAERLVIRDTEGELFGVPGQAVEFDAFVHDGKRFLVEVKGFAKPQDVLLFFRKMEFARRHLEEPFEPLLIAPFMRKQAARLARELGIRVLMHEEEEST